MATRIRTSRPLPDRSEVLERGAAEAGTFKAVSVPRDPVLRQRARTALTRNVTNIYRDAPPATVQKGREWYPKAHDEAVAVGRAVGGTTAHGAGIVAAISPSMPWELNIPAAHQMASPHDVPDHALHQMHEANETQKTYASIIEHHERAAAQAAGMPRGKRIKGAAPAALYEAHAAARDAHLHVRSFLTGTPLNNQSTDNILKAHAIRQGAAPESVLPMRQKTGHFYRNVNDPSDKEPVTVDTHAHDAARMSKLPFTTTRGLSSVGRYNHFADAYRNAAPRVGAELPHEVQATVWQHWKDNYGNDTSNAGGIAKTGGRGFEHLEPEAVGKQRTSQEYEMAARARATVRKRGRVVDPVAAAQGW